MKKSIFLLFALLFLVSCTEKRVTEDDLYFYGEKGLYIDKEKGKPYTGWVYKNYTNSNILYVEFYCKEGYGDGYMTFYYKDGTIQRKIYMEMSKPNESYDEYFDPEGNEISKEEFYENKYQFR